MSGKPTALPVKPQNIPKSLQAFDRWVLWSYKSRNGKWVKVPLQSNGLPASVKDPATWGTFADSMSAYLTNDFSGIGLVIPKGYVGVDLDDVIVDGAPTEECRSIMASLETYGETSPSGTGLKFLAAGYLSDELKKVCHARGIELYDGGDTNRFFTITGDVIDGDHADVTGQRKNLHVLQTLITEPISIKDLDPESEELMDSELTSKAVEYLENLDPDLACAGYADWLNVGMALHWCDNSDAMFERWFQWSQADPRCSEGECRAKWNSFGRVEGRLFTLTYLKQLALDYGYDPEKYQTLAISCTDLCNLTLTREFVVDDIMVKGEPMIIGGASKSLKTTIALDLALSISTGTKFLGSFETLEPQPVMFISGESGEYTLQENCKTMLSARDLDFSKAADLYMSFRLPKIDRTLDVESLIQEMRERDIRICFIDPLYRCFRVGNDASNVYSMGEKLELIAERIQRAGISTVLLHHFRKQGRTWDEPPDLEEFSQAGVAEFGRQFIMLKRLSSYKMDGNHPLWFLWGGSAGHQGLKALHCSTGTYKTGQEWKTDLMPIEDWKSLQEQQELMEKEEEKTLTMGVIEQEIRRVLTSSPKLAKYRILKEIGLRKTWVEEMLETLLERGELEVESGPRGAKHYTLKVVE